MVITDKFYGVGVDSSLLISVGNSPVRAGSRVELFFVGIPYYRIGVTRLGGCSLFFAEESG